MQNLRTCTSSALLTCMIFISARVSISVSLIYSRAAYSSFKPLQAVVACSGLSAWGLPPCRCRADCNLVYLKPRSVHGLVESPTAVRVDHFGTRLQTEEIRCREWSIKKCFSLSATHDRRWAEGVFRQRKQLQSEGTNTIFMAGMMGFMLLSWSTSIPSCCKLHFSKQHKVTAIRLCLPSGKQNFKVTKWQHLA